MDEHEEMEQVPWSELLAETDQQDRRRKAIGLGAALLAAVVLGFVVSRSWWSAPRVPDPVAPTTTPVDPPVEEEAALPEVPDLPLYSEADLMADPPDPHSMAAVTRAEWFVTDYFTADLEPSGSADIRAALPPEFSLDLPQDVGDTVSYVEWARAFRIEEIGDGAYLVGVAFRTLVAPPERGFTRQPVKAVEVRVQVGDDGAAGVLDLPTPITLPAMPAAVFPAGEESEPPPGVVETVTNRASLWGSEPRIVASHHLQGEWRVVVSVADGAGARWPLAMRIEDLS